MSGRSARHQWQGLWIWGSGGLAHEHRNEYCYLRKTFVLPSAPTSAKVRVSADNRYHLFVNGRRVGRGPARCEPRFQAYDEIDLAPFLHRGKNCIAALVHHFGESTFQSLERGSWGFLLDGEVHCRRGRCIPLCTDGSWKGIRAAPYNRGTSRYVAQLGFQEDFDAGREPPGWTRARFQDRRWPSATVYGAAGAMPFERLEPRGIPLEVERPAGFAGVTGFFTGRQRAEYSRPGDIGALLAEERRTPTRDAIFRDVVVGLKRGGGSMTVTPTPPGEFHALVLDAGKEVAAFLHLDVEAAGGEIIDFFCCEHVRRDGTAVVRARNGSLASIADRYRCRKGRQRHRFFSWKGFRYVLVVFRDVRRPIRVHHVGYDLTGYPVERRGSFECSDPLLNRIWETGAYTQQLCMHDAYIDCPWREQAQWWGDARVQWRVNQAVFGDRALFRRGLRQAAQSQTADGLTYGLSPCECHGCILPDYTLTWVCSIWEYYWYTGDDSPIREHFDAVVRALRWFEAHCRPDHLCGGTPAGLWLFLDWAPLFKGGRSATFTFQYLEALQAAVKLARHLGRTAEARAYAKLTRQVERAAVRAFWDARGKQFFEGYRPRENRPYRQVAQHGNAYAILTGVQARWHRQIAARIVWIQRNFDRLFKDNTGGNVHHPRARHPIASPFFYAHVLEALFRTGREHDALAAIRRLWGRMLAAGATTFYETWNHGPEVYGSSSACHAWSASPTYHLSEQVGGVRPLTPGFEQVRLAPRMFDLDFARVRTPTPRGSIDVEWERRGRTGIELTIRLPRRTRGVLELPGMRARRLPPGTHRVRTD